MTAVDADSDETKPCLGCGAPFPRDPKVSRCRACRAAQNRAWREANRERLVAYERARAGTDERREQDRAYRERHRDERNARNRAGRAANREKRTGSKRDAYWADPEAARAKNRAWRAEHLEEQRTREREQYARQRDANNAVRERRRTAECLDFLELPLAASPDRPLLLVLDNAGIHKARAVGAWLAEHPRVELLFLPAYSGHAENPVEKVWRRLKGHVAANRLHGTVDALIGATHEFFASFTPEAALRLAA